ncbi:hypothetical protein CYMTET_36516, partial [Cymbomonas tetramitiformis]
MRQGFFYNRYAPPASNVESLGTETDSNVDQQLWYHQVGTKQDEDILCYAIPEQPRWMIGAEVTDDGRYALLYLEEGCDPVNRLYYVDLNKCGGVTADFSKRVVKLVDDFRAQYSYVANEGERFVIKTTLQAPRYKLVEIEKLSQAGKPDSWRDLVPEAAGGAVLESAEACQGDALLLMYMQDVKHVLQLHSLRAGKLVKKFDIEIGCISSLNSRRTESEFFFKLSGFVTPGDVYRCDLADADPVPTLYRRTRACADCPAPAPAQEVEHQSARWSNPVAALVARSHSVPASSDLGSRPKVARSELKRR